MSSEITFKNQYGTYSIEIPDDDLDIKEVAEKLLVPVLLAAGYHIKAIEKYIKNE